MIWSNVFVSSPSKKIVSRNDPVYGAALALGDTVCSAAKIASLAGTEDK